MNKIKLCNGQVKTDIDVIISTMTPTLMPPKITPSRTPPNNTPNTTPSRTPPTNTPNTTPSRTRPSTTPQSTPPSSTMPPGGGGGGTDPGGGGGTDPTKIPFYPRCRATWQLEGVVDPSVACTFEGSASGIQVFADSVQGYTLLMAEYNGSLPEFYGSGEFTGIGSYGICNNQPETTDIVAAFQNIYQTVNSCIIEHNSDPDVYDPVTNPTGPKYRQPQLKYFGTYWDGTQWINNINISQIGGAISQSITNNIEDLKIMNTSENQYINSSNFKINISNNCHITKTPTKSPAPTRTVTRTPKVTRTVTKSLTPTHSVTKSHPITRSLTPTVTSTPTVTLTPTRSTTPTPTYITDITTTPTITQTITPTPTKSQPITIVDNILLNNSCFSSNWATLIYGTDQNTTVGSLNTFAAWRNIYSIVDNNYSIMAGAATNQFVNGPDEYFYSNDNVFIDTREAPSSKDITGHYKVRNRILANQSIDGREKLVLECLSPNTIIGNFVQKQPRIFNTMHIYKSTIGITGSSTKARYSNLFVAGRNAGADIYLRINTLLNQSELSLAAPYSGMLLKKMISVNATNNADNSLNSYIFFLYQNLLYVTNSNFDPVGSLQIPNSSAYDMVFYNNKLYISDFNKLHEIDYGGTTDPINKYFIFNILKSINFNQPIYNLTLNHLNGNIYASNTYSDGEWDRSHTIVNLLDYSQTAINISSRGKGIFNVGNNKLYIGHGSDNYISVVDPITNNEINKIDTIETPTILTIDNKQTLYCGSNKIQVIDILEENITRTQPIPSFQSISSTNLIDIHIDTAYGFNAPLGRAFIVKNNNIETAIF